MNIEDINVPAGTYWCAVVGYHDGSGLLGVYGPHGTKQGAEKGAKRLREVGVHPHEKWEIMPLRKIELGQVIPDA